MKYPAELFYSTDHLWVRIDPQGQWLAGITDYAQDLLGDIVYLELPKVGDMLTNGQPCGIVESVKTGSDLHAPMNGAVTDLNEALLASPEQINDNPYDAWIFKFTPADAADKNHLLSAEAYEKQVSD